MEDVKAFEFHHEMQYWVTFQDGSRIKVEAWQDKHGDIDIHNDDLDFLLHVTTLHGKPVNRDHLAGVEQWLDIFEDPMDVTDLERDCE